MSLQKVNLQPIPAIFSMGITVYRDTNSDILLFIENIPPALNQCLRVRREEAEELILALIDALDD